MAEPAGISVEIRNQHPIELADLTKSYFAFAEEYRRFCEKHPSSDDVGARLYVKQIRPGSIIADLQPMAVYALQFWEHVPQVIGFLKHLKECYDFLLGNTQQKPELDRPNLENLASIVEPVAKDGGSQLIVGSINFNAPVTMTLGSMQANAVQNAVKRELAALKEPVTGIREKVLLYWYQARNDPKSKAGDRAIIESVYAGPVKTIFATESIKAKLLTDTENLFTQAYIVDVAIETINGRPMLYRILEMHEHFDRESPPTVSGPESPTQLLP